MDDSTILALLTTVAHATATSSIVVNGAPMAPLLKKTPTELLGFWKRGLSAIAMLNGQIIGHAAIEPLTEDWHELGIVWTHPDFRGKSAANGGVHSHVGLRVCEALLKRHGKEKILMTTINEAMMVVGWRTEMVPIAYSQLPEAAWKATCCCPAEKTGVASEANVPHCKLRERTCFVQVTRETWEQLGRPEPRMLPVGPPATAAIFPNDDIAIILAG